MPTVRVGRASTRSSRREDAARGLGTRGRRERSGRIELIHPICEAAAASRWEHCDMRRRSGHLPSTRLLRSQGRRERSARIHPIGSTTMIRSVTAVSRRGLGQRDPRPAQTRREVRAHPIRLVTDIRAALPQVQAVGADERSSASSPSPSSAAALRCFRLLLSGSPAAVSRRRAHSEKHFPAMSAVAPVSRVDEGLRAQSASESAGRAHSGLRVLCWATFDALLPCRCLGSSGPAVRCLLL